VTTPSLLAFRLATALNAIAASTWILLLLERSGWGRSRVSDYGSALGPVALFFIIPLGAAGVWWLRRRDVEPLSRWRRNYLRLSSAFLAVTWAVSLLPMIFWAGLLSVQVSTMWPLNLREGPDTEFGQACFREHFGFPPDGVDDLYCRRGWEFGDGNTYRMRFHFGDPATLGRVVRAAGLVPVPETALVPSWGVELDPPAWWPRPGFAGYQRTFQAAQSRPRLWVDQANGIAYYRSWP
jgi:hypothetical protein